MNLLYNDYNGSNDIYSYIEQSNATIINNNSSHDCLFKVLSIIIYGNEINFIIIKDEIRLEKLKPENQLFLKEN